MAAYIPVIGVTFNISVFMILAFLLVLQLRFKKYKASFSYALIDLEAMMFLYTVLKIIALYLRIVTDQDRTTAFYNKFFSPCCTSSCVYHALQVLCDFLQARSPDAQS